MNKISLVNIDHIDSANIKIYLGNQAGSSLEKDIDESQKSILVDSPYISKDKIAILLQKSKN